VRCVFIRDHAVEFPITIMCRVLEVSRAGYYAWRRRGLSERSWLNEWLAAEIKVIHEASRQTYGSPRVHEALKARGTRCSRKRVARVMRSEGIHGRKRRRFRATTNSRHPNPIAENMLERAFAVSAIGSANRVWAADITYVPTWEGWLYLAVVLDLGSRRVVGWSMRHTLDTGLVLDALEMALAERRPPHGLMHHSDRGSQYASHEYRQVLAERGISCSMSRKGDCWDNAVVESFFATLKTELVHDRSYRTREEARREIFEYIEVWYNRKRLHSSLGYFSPEKYESRQVA